MPLIADVCFTTEGIACIVALLGAMTTAVTVLFWQLRDSYRRHLDSVESDRAFWRDEAIRCGCRPDPAKQLPPHEPGR